MRAATAGLAKDLSGGIGRVDEYTNGGRRGDQLVRQFQSLRCYLHMQFGHAGDVAARSAQAGDEADLHRIAAGG